MSKLRPVHAMAVAVTALVFAATGISVAADSGSSSGTDRASGGPSAHASASKRGPRGKTGPRGPAGILALKTVSSPEITLAPDFSTYDVAPETFEATCPSGWAVVGTGFTGSVGHTSFVNSYGTLVGGFIYNDTGISIEVSVQAICAKVPSGTSVTRTASDAADRFEADAAAAQAAVR